ncbi:Indigoidine synthase A like protein-domain-containing protein [Rhypophila decipiens]|uniref:Indigoidine synthase A like protein-domain-containing protein n=1 Tax=Rhypophila decipiens TaxID=261697 RepID=A0AAN7BE76_9PEZI|nr:Indigoidine synthase A like protein-domain-containing protein [Rhypophila decipiens]
MAVAGRSLSSTSRLLYSSPSAARLVTQSRCTRQTLHKHGRHYYSTKNSKSWGVLSGILDIRPEVADAVASNAPVVALESTIYTHGKLGNDLDLENIVRKNGAVPAVCGILNGVPTVGLTPDEVERMIHEGAKKASRRDLAFLVGQSLAGSKMHGGTTISGTMVLARLAGIRVFGTGGLGGVHRGGENSLDISADLTELGRTRVAVISSGCKGFLDIPRTLEYLETQGAFVATFADGRKGDIDFPAFWARDSGTKSPAVVQTEKEAASIIYAQERLGIESGMLFANPIPEEDGIPRDQMQSAIETAVREAEELGFTGALNTPHILYRIRELTGGASVPANKALVRSNVARAATVAVQLSKLIQSTSSSSQIKSSYTFHTPATSSIPALKVNVTEESKASTAKHDKQTHTADVLVAGSVALDLSCDYAGGVSKGGGKQVSPALHTSNPASISQSIGGVGHNVALAAHRVSEDGQVRLCSLVGDDIAGSTILSAIKLSGLDPSCIRTLGNEYPSARTAQYVSVNDADKNLMVAMADMAIFTTHSFPKYWDSAVSAAKPKFLVVDANFSDADIFTFLQSGKRHGATTIFEPVSAAKSKRLFPPLLASSSSLHPSSKKKAIPPAGLRLYPHATLDLATPNQHELEAMYTAARENEYFSTSTMPGHIGSWFSIIDAFGIHGGAREKFVYLTSRELTDAGIPLQAVSLLPYIPTIITKLGANGALLTQLMKREDPRLKDPRHAEFILCRTDTGAHEHSHVDVGGVYMRLYPAVERVPTQEVVSVNGVGDTFLGVLVAGLNMGGRVEDLVDVAQQAAVLTLKSRESVSLELVGLRGALREAVSFSQGRG